MFDTVTLQLKAGNGGDGHIGWRREKYEPKGGPHGGDGGKGGSIFLVGSSNLNSLIDYRYKTKFKAENGSNGMNNLKTGKDGADLYLYVPLGTIVRQAGYEGVLYDFKEDGETFEVVKGGRGGRGNWHFRTATRQAPTFMEPGRKGEEASIILELKLIADVGLVGFPNVGKSSLLSIMSAAKPKIANYHFTTLEPNLGVCKIEDGKSFVIADIPGIIEGASEGAGLGFKFLKHIERVKLLVHVLDVSGSEGRDPLDDYYKLRTEMESFSDNIAKKEEIIVLNKSDLISAEELEEKKAEIEEKTGRKAFVVSAATKAGIKELEYKIFELNSTIKNFELVQNKTTLVQKENPTNVYYDNGIYYITGDKVEFFFRSTDFSEPDSVRRFDNFLESEGINARLEKLGVEDGDTVDILGYQFEHWD
ncbi:MAG: GTPase ObgE [Ezakiella sp.]|nr:GTPase ObgE [Ezakiella sp.]MDD7471401.1 GTPase ObgE [Bacillota bacterium]MDY3922898.1 GTPase ObgE [Ezakiella sp.]